MFMISDFLNLQHARKLKSFVQRCVKVFTGKSLENNAVFFCFFFAVIIREFGI